MRRFATLLLVTLLGLTQVGLANKKWDRAEILLTSDDAITDQVSILNDINLFIELELTFVFFYYQDMKDWLTSQPQIKRIYDENAPTPRLQMYREGSENPDETLFIAHVPGSMVKNILEEKNLVKNMYDDL